MELHPLALLKMNSFLGDFQRILKALTLKDSPQVTTSVVRQKQEMALKEY